MTYHSIMESPVQGISGVWRFVREPHGYHRACSLPGHLLHLIAEGHYRLRTNGREYAVRKGDIVYYHETEDVEWLENRVKVVFYSVGFLAPQMEPPPFDQRVLSSTDMQRQAFHRIYEASLMPSGIQRQLLMHASLASLLASLDIRTTSENSDVSSNPWWRMEARLRSEKRFHASLDALAKAGHMSRATVVRTCKRATGQSPGKRLQAIRMQEAKGLLSFSHLSITQIADYLGYARLNEFSREFSAYAGLSPRQFREQH